MPYRFRFTLGQLMGFIALSALFIAAALFSNQGRHTFFVLLLAAIGCAGLGVFFYNRRLSGWMWVVIAGYGGPTLLGAVGGLLMLLLPSPLTGNTISTINLILNGVGSLLLVVGFAMTFRNIRRRLAICENTQ